MAPSGSAEPQTQDPGALDALLDRIVEEELATLRRAFDEGAEFAVTRAGRRDETLHRLECPSLAPHLDRRARWTDEHRQRLAADGAYRIPLPALLTRERARALVDVRGCKVCWPNLSGLEPRPLKRITARRLRPHHAGRVLATPTGESLGTILRSAQRRGADLFGVEHDEIEVVTSSRAILYAPGEDVYLWDLPSDSQAIERKVRLFAQLGSASSPS